MIARLRYCPALLVIAAAPLALLWPLVLESKVLYWGTPLLQFYEWRSLVVEAYRTGHFPLWTHLLGNGYPLLANLQSAALYPLNAVYLFVPPEHATGYSVILHLALAGFFTFIFVRSLGVGRTAALVSALAYSLSAFLVGRAQFISMVNGAAWLPLLFWLTGRVVRRRRVVDAFPLGLAIALQLLAGHAQLWYYSLWAIALYALFLSVTQPRSRLQSAFTIGLLLIGAVLIGLLASAAQLLPTAELAALSQRSAGANWDFAMTYSFWPWRLLTFVAPDFFGNPAHGDFWGYANYWEDAAYVGLLPLLLAVTAVAVRLRRGRGRCPSLAQVPFFAALAVLALLLSLGKNLPIYPFVFRYVPGFSFFQAPSRFLFWYTFAVAVLAGVGLEYLGSSLRWVRTSRYLLALSLSLLLTAALAGRVLSNLPRATFLPALLTTAILAVLSAAVIFASTHRLLHRQPAVWHVAVVALVLGDLLWFGRPLNPTTDPAIYHLETSGGAFLRERGGSEVPFRTFVPEPYNYDTKFDKERGFFRFSGFGSSSIERLQLLRESLIPNLSVLERLESANNYDPLQVGHYQALIERLESAPADEQARVLALMNVRYVVDDREHPELVLVRPGAPKIYENAAAFPRAWVVSKAMVTDPARQLDTVFFSWFDPRREVIVSAEQMSPSFSESAGEVDAEVSLQYGPNSVTMVATLPLPGYLVLADTDYPDWRVIVDGESRHVLRANYAFRTVWLAAGRHELEWRYEPVLFRVGLWLSGSTWLIAAIILLTGRLRRRQPAERS